MDTVIMRQDQLLQSDLYKYSQKELDQLFSALDPVNLMELDGVYKGRLFAVIGLNAIPRFLRVMVYRILQTMVNPWRGKFFSKGEGANVWLTRSGKFQFGRYKTIENSEENDNYLNYDVQKNWRVLRPIRGEAKQLSQHTVLARMNYLTKKGTVRVLYFTLSPSISGDTYSSPHSR